MNEIFPDHYTVLLSGSPGVGKFEYCLSLANDYLKNWEKVVYVTTERSPKEIMERASSLGMKLPKYEGSTFIFVDAFTWSVGTKYGEGLYIENPSNLNELSITINKAVSEIGKPVRIFFDSLSPIFLHNPIPATSKFFQALASKTKTDYGFLLTTLQDGVHDPQVVNTLMYLVDGYLQMQFEEEGHLERKLRVHHLKGLSTDPRWQAFAITKEGFRFK